MIPAHRIRELTGLTTHALSHILEDSGYTGTVFTHAVFVGINNNCVFVYYAEFNSENDEGQPEWGYVYVNYIAATDTLTAEFKQQGLTLAQGRAIILAWYSKHRSTHNDADY